MKITAKDIKVKSVIPSVTIELDEMESGFLRAICHGYCGGQLNAGFASRLFQELDRYQFVSYDRAHPNWKETNRLRGKW